MIGLFEGLKTAEINVKRTYQFGRGEPGCILCSIDLQGTAEFLAVTHHHGGFGGFGRTRATANIT
jgi:hypothetical protein